MTNQNALQTNLFIKNNLVNTRTHFIWIAPECTKNAGSIERIRKSHTRKSGTIGIRWEVTYTLEQLICGRRRNGLTAFSVVRGVYFQRPKFAYTWCFQMVNTTHACVNGCVYCDTNILKRFRPHTDKIFHLNYKYMHSMFWELHLVDLSVSNNPFYILYINIYYIYIDEYELLFAIHTYI